MNKFLPPQTHKQRVGFLDAGCAGQNILSICLSIIYLYTRQENGFLRISLQAFCAILCSLVCIIYWQQWQRKAPAVKLMNC